MSPEQAQTLKRHEEFKIWINTEEGRLETQEHIKHVHYFKEKLSHQNLNKMTEGFMEVWKKSYASNFWSNKDWYIKHRLIGANAIEKIREGLDLMLYGSENFVTRSISFPLLVPALLLILHLHYNQVHI